MSEFLVLKSTREQLEEGAAVPTDTAFIDDNEGLPLLKIVFDVHHFREDEVKITVEENRLALHAQSTEDGQVAVFKKTMIRMVDLPGFVDSKRMHCYRSTTGGFLTVTMPFHLPPKRRPSGPNILPIIEDCDGKRRIRLVTELCNKDLVVEDIQVVGTGDKQLLVTASYNAAQPDSPEAKVSKRQFRRKYRLPDNIEVERVDKTSNEDGRLVFEIILRAESLSYKCEVTTEECSTADADTEAAVSNADIITYTT